MKSLSLLLLLAACGDNLHPGGHVDAGPDGPKPDAPNQMGVVMATATVHHLTEAGDVTSVAQNLQIIDSTNAIVLPTTTGNMLKFSPVAAGPYLICDTSLPARAICTQESAATLDLDYYSVGRPDFVYGTQNSKLTLTVTGASPAPSGTNEFLDVRALNVDTEDYPAPPTVAGPLVAPLDFFQRGLLAAGDVLRVTQLVEKTSGSDVYEAAVRFGSVTGIAMTTGQNTAAAVTLGTNLPQTSTVSFTLKRALFDSLAGSPGANATNKGCEINGFSETRPYTWKRWIFWFPAPDAMTTDKTLSFTYGTPGPAANTETFEVACSHGVPVTAPGAATGASLTMYAAAYRPIAELTGNVSPVLSRATAIKVNGMDASVGQTGTTETPTISWTAPSMGTATRYTLFVFRLVNNGGTAVTVPGVFTTNNTSFKLPPGIVHTGEGYAVSVRAEVIPGFDPTTPYAAVPRSELADALTAVLQP